MECWIFETLRCSRSEDSSRVTGGNVSAEMGSSLIGLEFPCLFVTSCEFLQVRGVTASTTLNP